MSFIHALILGIIQGLTEFFPVSSSAHLKLTQMLFHLPEKDQLLIFDLICHLGTVTALCLYLRKDLVTFFSNWRNMKRVALAILPLVLMYFLPFRHFFKGEIWIGFFLIFTSAFLFLSSRMTATTNEKAYKKRDVFFIGCMQALALFPGISRSGSTISAACFRGWTLKQAIQFSFFLSVPTVLGGNILELLKASSKATSTLWTLPFSFYLIGFTASLVMGSLGVRLIFSLANPSKLRGFAWYCLALGVFSVLYVSYAT